jgi:hypothetical protein
MKRLEEYIEKATTNIREDRAATKTLLMNLLKFMQISDERHKEVGLIAAKYLETLQRSNEQLVKIAALVSRKESSVTGLSDDDRKDLFDIIKESKESDVTKEGG